jgi:hypothetical protein
MTIDGSVDRILLPVFGNMFIILTISYTGGTLGILKSEKNNQEI